MTGNNIIATVDLVNSLCFKADFFGDEHLFDFLHQRRVGAIQELRYSAIEVKYYVFKLKCLVPEFLQRVKKSGSELLGHKDVSTTMIYTHVLNRGGRAVQSPGDMLWN